MKKHILTISNLKVITLFSIKNKLKYNEIIYNKGVINNKK